jgi:hypothetical protein
MNSLNYILIQFFIPKINFFFFFFFLDIIEIEIFMLFFISNEKFGEYFTVVFA